MGQTIPKGPPEKVFWRCFGGLNPFSGGTWTLRAWILICRFETADEV